MITMDFTDKQKAKVKELEEQYGVYTFKLPKVSGINSYGTRFVNVEDLCPVFDKNFDTAQRPQLTGISEMEYSKNYAKSETLSFYYLDRFYTIDVFHDNNRRDFYVLETSTNNELCYFYTLHYALETLKAIAYVESLANANEHIVVQAPKERKYLDQFLVDKA